MQKWSVNPKSDMQTLQAYEDLFKKGYETKEIIYDYCWLIWSFWAAALCAAAAVRVEEVFS